MAVLTPVRQAIEIILEDFSVLDTQIASLSKSTGRVLATSICSTLPLPPFDASSVDGFALRWDDVITARTDNPISLQVVADIPAGVAPSCNVQMRQAARIMTGAALPSGANAIVMVEDTDYGVRSSGTPHPKEVKVMRSVSPGENIRPRGQDIQEGEKTLSGNQFIRPEDVGMLAMLGKVDIPVIRRPCIAIITPGEELTSPGKPLMPGKIYDSNSHMIRSLIEAGGGISIDSGIIADNIVAVRNSLDEAIDKGVDCLVSTGGVSVGAYDFVRAVLETDGELKLWRVNIRPGKPLAFGHYRNVPFIGLPGNPVSAFVSFKVFVQPVLRKMLGLPRAQHTVRKVQLNEMIHSDGRESYLRAVVNLKDDCWIAHLTGPQGSGNLHSLVQANALLVIPAGVKSLNAGSKVDAWFYSAD